MTGLDLEPLPAQEPEPEPDVPPARRADRAPRREHNAVALVTAALLVVGGAAILAVSLARLDRGVGAMHDDLRSQSARLDRMEATSTAPPDGTRLTFVNPCRESLSVVLTNPAGTEVWRGDLHVGLTDSPVDAVPVDNTWRLEVLRPGGAMTFELGRWVDRGTAVIPAVACP